MYHQRQKYIYWRILSNLLCCNAVVIIKVENVGEKKKSNKYIRKEPHN